MRYLLLLINTFLHIFDPQISIRARVENSKINKKAKIWRYCVLNHAQVGAYSYIGPKSRVTHARIGKFCSIAGDSVIGMGTHSLGYLSTSSLFTAPKNGTGTSWAKKQNFEEYKDVIIGNDVWLGQRAMVMGGVHIGNGAVIGAGAIVTKDVPPYAIVAGVPAKIIRYRFTQETIDTLEQSAWWQLDDETLRKNISLFQGDLDEEKLNNITRLCQKMKI